MKLHQFCSTALIVGTLLAPIAVTAPAAPVPSPQEEGVDVELIFPVPAQDLLISIGGDATPSLADVLKSFEEICAHNLHISAETRAHLKNVSTGLSRSVTIPAREVYSFVSTLLDDSGFLMMETRSAEPRLLSIYSLSSQERNQVRSRARAVPLDEVYRYERHPAMVIQTVLEIEHIDARQLTNAMRSIIVDPNTEQAVPIWENSILLVGRGPQVADWIRLIRTADAQGKPEKTPEPPAEQGDEK